MAATSASVFCPAPSRPDSSDFALSSLQRFSHHVLPDARLAGRRHRVCLRSPKPLALGHLRGTKRGEIAETTAQGDSSKSDAAVAYVMRHVDALLPHFARDLAQESLEGRPQDDSLGEEQSDLPWLDATRRLGSGISGHLRLQALWEVDWSPAAEAVQSVLSFAQGITFIIEPEDGAAELTEVMQPIDGPSSFLASLQGSVSPPPFAQPKKPPSSKPLSREALSQRKEFLRAELEMLETMLRPQSSWPNALVGVANPTPLADVVPVAHPQRDEAQEVVMGPRCAWPRQSGRSQALLASATTVAVPALSTLAAPLEPAHTRSSAIGSSSQLLAEDSMHNISHDLSFTPRCNWPRARLAASVAASATSLPMAADVEVPASPRCPWPRNSIASTQAVSGTPKESSLVVAPASSGPRCSWPRPSALAAATALAPTANEPSVVQGAVAARCSWPRQLQRAGTEVLEPVVSANVTGPKPLMGLPELVAKPAGLVALAPQQLGVGAAGSLAPRCAWPRAAQNTSAPPELSLGPRCSWPRATQNSLSAAEPSLGPRCSWPRAHISVSDSCDTDPGPRCAWPRSHAVVAAAVDEADEAWQVLPEIARKVALDVERPSSNAVTNGSRSPAASGEVASLAPRCAWPRSAVSLAAENSTFTEPVAGPRCAWPRANSVLQTQNEEIQKEEVAVWGPRCAWPRAGSVVPTPTVQSAPAGVAEVVGPRCAWPRKSAPRTVESVEQDKTWELLPAFAVSENETSAGDAEPIQTGHKTSIHAIHRISKSSHGLLSGDAVMGPRCPWPRASLRSSMDVLHTA